MWSQLLWQKKYKFIKTILRGIEVNMNTCFISDIVEIDGKAQVFINGEWWQTDLTKKQIFNIHNAI